MTPPWLLDMVAGVMLAVAAVSAARLVAARPWRPGSVIIDTDIAHLLMAIAMAGVLTSALSTLPNAAWEVIFAVMIAWFAFRIVRDARANGVRALTGGHCAPHLVHSGAMLYMFLGMTASAGAMAGIPARSSSMLMVSDPTLGFVFALVLVGYSVWDLDQLSGRRYGLVSARVSLAGVRAGVPAMAGAESAGRTPFSGPNSSNAVTDTRTGSAAVGDQAAVGGHTALAGHTAVGGAHVAGGASGQFLLSPAVTVGCRVTMGVVMTFMLLIAI